MTCEEAGITSKNNANGRLWLCAALSLAVAAAIVLLLELSFWTIIFFLIFLACPIAIGWAYFMGQWPLPIPVGPVPETRGLTLNWIAPWYDNICIIFGLGKRFRDRTLSVAGLKPGEHVLDVGCGTGVLTRRAIEIVGLSGAARGIDPAPDMIRLARQEAGRVRNAAHFDVAAIEALPFPDASFDVVLASLVLHHLPPDLKAAGLAEVYRVLRPGGRLVVVDLDQPSHWFWRIIFWPMSFHSRMRDHLRGQMGGILLQAGFGAVTVSGNSMGYLTFWSASKAV